MTLYPFDIIAYKGDETLPLGCVDKESVMSMAKHLLASGYDVVTVRERIGSTAIFRVINHIDVRWMADL
jgi:hypothetical protein